MPYPRRRRLLQGLLQNLSSAPSWANIAHKSDRTPSRLEAAWEWLSRARKQHQPESDAALRRTSNVCDRTCRVIGVAHVFASYRPLLRPGSRTWTCSAAIASVSPSWRRCGEWPRATRYRYNNGLNNRARFSAKRIWAGRPSHSARVSNSLLAMLASFSA